METTVIALHTDFSRGGERGHLPTLPNINSSKLVGVQHRWKKPGNLPQSIQYFGPASLY